MYDEFKDLVEINKIRNHFICKKILKKKERLNLFKKKEIIMFIFCFKVSIESTGAMSASTLMKQSIEILMMKTQILLNEINSKKC